MQLDTSVSVLLLSPCPLFIQTITMPRFIVIKRELNDATVHIKVMVNRQLPNREAVQNEIFVT